MRLTTALAQTARQARSAGVFVSLLPSPAIDSGPFPADLNGSNFTYPWPVNVYRFRSQGQELEMAFMDVAPAVKTAVLLHGKNFCAATWAETASRLSGAGYRVIVPDQVGFCKSSKPEPEKGGYQFSLQQLALNTRGLLAALGVVGDGNRTVDGGGVLVVGHSLGGMLAIRYGLMYSADTVGLTLVNPIGLEDWKAVGVPYIDIDASFESERASDYASIRAYEQATYYVGVWSEQYDVWVRMLVNIYRGSRALAYARAQALVVDMVLTQPVVYELGLLRPRTLLVIGEKDTTAIGKQWSPPEVQEKLGHYSVLGKRAAAAIPNCTLVEFPPLGHAPQIEDPDKFHEALLAWL
ncbi:Alpha/Beta hydrolase protein [Lasiosphaeria ovina]|uniref:Alpha/Beta hydrolase protein n=1 Tax=Lasiosphaeria ovina TaxID=92902 RepID=A0AAE0NIH4_9PEZI|nr:Alpha/Beta hydrolase protein [Lasiosphaeria ovina]